MSEDTIKSITEDFKSLLIESQKDLQGKKALKQYAAIVKASKEEYQSVNENQQIKKELTNMKIILNSNSNKDTTNSNKNLFNNKRNF